MKESDPANIEVRLLLDAIFFQYGYDFRSYAKASIKRRIAGFLTKYELTNISELQHHVLHDEMIFRQLLLEFSINVTEMFRDPLFYKAVCEKVLPGLLVKDHLKIWHAGCASGEEIYSLAILLSEAGLYERTQIYGTDFNEVILKKAREGIYPINKLKLFTQNYQLAGGVCDFSDYYTAKFGSAVMNQSLKKNIVFADHNLATDGVFGEMDLIFCRNVLIYFDKNLQDRVFGLFSESLTPGGMMCLGARESVKFSKYVNDFEDFDAMRKIYRKKEVL